MLDVEKIKSMDQMEREILASSPETDVNTLKLLSRDEESWVRQEVAKNPNTPSNLLNSLYKDVDYRVRKYIALNPNTKKETLIDMLKHEKRDRKINL